MTRLVLLLYITVGWLNFGGFAHGQFDLAKNEWGELANRSSGVYCKVRLDYGDPKIPLEDLEFYVAGNEVCMIVRYGDRTQRVACTNQKYAFELTRSSENESWTLKSLFLSKDGTHRTTPPKGVALPQISIVPQDMDWTAKQKSFTFLRASGVDHFEFDCEAKYVDRRARTNVSLRVDATKRFSVTEWEGRIVSELDSGAIKGRVSYGDKMLDGWPVPRKCELVISDLEGSVNPLPPAKWTYFYDEWSFQRVPREQFQLSGFGLKEPIFDSDRSPFFFYTALIVAVLLLLFLAGWRSKTINMIAK